MKKLILASLLATSLETEAQNFRSMNFLNPVTSITLSNTMNYTNLQSTASAPGTGFMTTNATGLIYTNLSGNQVIVSTNDVTQLSTDIPLWANRNGDLILGISGSNSVWSGAISQIALVIHSPGGGAGSTNPVNFTFSPICDGINESTSANDYWTVAFTGLGTGPTCLVTNAPMWKWPGCKSLRLRTAYQTNVIAASQITIDRISLDGFVP